MPLHRQLFAHNIHRIDFFPEPPLRLPGRQSSRSASTPERRPLPEPQSGLTKCGPLGAAATIAQRLFFPWWESPVAPPGFSSGSAWVCRTARVSPIGSPARCTHFPWPPLPPSRPLLCFSFRHSAIVTAQSANVYFLLRPLAALHSGPLLQCIGRFQGTLSWDRPGRSRGGQRGACNVPPPRGLRTGKLGKIYAAMIYIGRMRVWINKYIKKTCCGLIATAE